MSLLAFKLVGTGDKPRRLALPDPRYNTDPRTKQENRVVFEFPVGQIDHDHLAGASDFVEKPYDEDSILGAVRDALARRNMPAGTEPGAQEAMARLGELSRREMDVLKGLLAGKSNKMIAIDLGISSRTVEAYRANMMDKLQVRSLPEAVRLAIAGGVRG